MSLLAAWAAWLGASPVRPLALVAGLFAALAVARWALGPRVAQACDGVRRLLDRLEGALLLGLLALLLGLSFVQVALRLAHGGLPWADVLNRHLVLWIGLLGAALAAARNRHIRIDALNLLLPAGLKRGLGALTDVLAAWICLRLSVAGLAFVAQTREYGDMLPVLPWPAWPLQAVIPAGFLLMSVHFCLQPLLRWHGPSAALFEMAPVAAEDKP